MSIQTQLLTLLNNATTAGDRIYPMTAPDVVVKPYITYQRISGSTENVLSGSSGLTNTRMQIDVYSTTYGEAQAIAAQVDALMAGWSVQNVSLPSQDAYEPDVKLYRVILEYSIWHS
jgi:hypothetical protein